MKSGKARQLLKKLDYLPRWAWYMLAFFIGAGPFGVIAVYLAFHALEKIAQEEDDEELNTFTWSVDIDREGVHVRRRQDGYADEDCVVTDDAEVSRQWQRAEESASRATTSSRATAAGRATTANSAAEGWASVASSASAAQGDDASVADVIRMGNEAIRRLRRADEIIADPELSAQIVSIEESCSQILSILEARPQVLPQLRTFLRYYLPTTLKLLEARSKLENRANTPKAREVCARISEAIGAVDKAFKRQVEALDEYRFIDLESEMDVLRDMLRSDGLIDEERAGADPFADVLAARRGGKQDMDNMPMAGH